MRAGITRMIAAVAICLCALSGASAQDAPKGTLSGLVRRLTAPGGIAAKAKPGTTPDATRFKPSGTRLIRDELVAKLGPDESSRQGLLGMFDHGMDTVEEAQSKKGRANNIAVACTMFVAAQWSAATGNRVSDAAGEALLAQSYALFDKPEVKAVSDADKQRFYEYCIYMSVFTSGMREIADSDKEKRQVRDTASKLFQRLLHVRPEDVSITAERGLLLQHRHHTKPLSSP